MTKICVTGYKGRLGSALCNLSGYTPLVCNITTPDEVNSAIEKERPDVIINCAALTDVDAAEDDYERFYNVNGVAINNFTDFVANGGKLIQISTDYVFDGKHGPYKETDTVIHEDWLGRSFEPVNSYGWSKFAGEVVAGFLDGDVCIVRTTGLYGSDNDFARSFFLGFESREPVSAVTKLRGNHTYIPHLVKMLGQLLSLSKLPDIIHLASDDVMSRYDFCMNLAKVFSYDTHLVRKISTVDWWKAARPTKGGLKVDLAKKLGITVPTTLEGITDYYRGQILGRYSYKGA